MTVDSTQVGRVEFASDAEVAKFARPSMPGSMLWPLLSMLLGFMLFFGGVLCLRLRGEVLNRERQSSWVREVVRAS